MTTPRQKANVGLTLLVLFLITLVTGIILHLKSHGILIQPRAVIKTVHWSAGFLMVVFTCWHGSQFLKMFNGMKQRFRWFWCDTWAVIILTFLTFTTGLVKLLSPVKIPHRNSNGRFHSLASRPWIARMESSPETKIKLVTRILN